MVPSTSRVLHRRVAAAFQPFNELRDLGGAAGAVRALYDNEFARQLVEVHSGDAVAVKTPLAAHRHDKVIGALHSTVSSSTLGLDRRARGKLGGGGDGLRRL